MTNVEKKPLDGKPSSITVYSFAGNILIATEQGSYWASAVGGVVESRPTGNSFVPFSLWYIWDMAGEVFEFPKPVRIRLNTAMAVTETSDFKFPVPEVPVEVPVEVQETPSLMEDEDDEIDDEIEDEIDDEIEGWENGEFSEDFTSALCSDNEISW